ncbi:MAG TPA: HEAT repeat domain-containing protein [Planctomycetota bacterium]|nr:HEAT repeat domain-containing protein [Planctomycetota bacterium]
MSEQGQGRDESDVEDDEEVDEETEGLPGAADEDLGEDDGEGAEYVELTKIHNVRDRSEGQLVRSILESFHIPCVIEDQDADVLSGLLPNELDGIDVFVPADYAERAKLVLCERNIVCGIDQKRLADLMGAATDGAATDAAKRAALLQALGEETRDYRHEALSTIGKRDHAGFELLRALLADAVRIEDRVVKGAEGQDEKTAFPVASDIAYLTDLGTFGKDNALLILADLGKLAKDPDPKVRARVARALGRLRGVGAGPELVDFLLDDDAGVRDEALESLYALSQGETFDFDPDLSPASQEAAIKAWRAWARDNAAA